MIDIIQSLASFDDKCDDFSHISELVAAEEGFSIDALSIVVCGHSKISELNKTYLERDYTTDVLAFDLRTSADSTSLDGEIYLDAETAKERAPEFETNVGIELRRYLIHGLLHLMNYHDKDEKGQQAMRNKENYYLSKIEI